MLRRTLGSGVVVLFVSIFSLAADGGKVENVGAFADSNASEAVRKALAPAGYRVVLADGSEACQIWFRAVVPAGKTDAPGAVYTAFSESVFLGVIQFAKAANDFRGQSIKPGTYALRYAVHPSDGNHLGISPIRDFLLLVPIATDPNPDVSFKFEELAKMSAKAAGTNHPAILSMVTPEGTGAQPSVKTDEQNHTVFATKIKTASGEVPIALIVKGVAEQ